MAVTTKSAAQLTLTLAAGLACFPAYRALAENVTFGEVIPMLAKYTAPASDGDGKPRGISGMACLAKRADGGRECLVINDEETFGEIAELTAAGLRPTGMMLAFVKDGEAGAGIVGTEQVAGCSPDKKREKFGELDGEGVAVADGYAYVASSHSCSGKGKYKPSSYLISRVKLASATSFPAGASVERTWRGADMLLASGAASGYGAAKAIGTNIEGVGVADGVLYAGLRTPRKDNMSFLLSAPVDDLFATGEGKLAASKVKSRSLALGADTGIRDLAATDSGGLLILAGPTENQSNVEFRLWHLPAPIATSDPKEIAVIKTTSKVKDGKEVPKAESVTIIEQTAEKVVVVINYDNIDEGAPTRHEISLKP